MRGRAAGPFFSPLPLPLPLPSTQHQAAAPGLGRLVLRTPPAAEGLLPTDGACCLVPRGGRVCVCARLLVGSAEAQVLHASGRITCDHDEQAATECVGSSKFDPSASGLRNACNHVMPKVQER